MLLNYRALDKDTSGIYPSKLILLCFFFLNTYCTHTHTRADTLKGLMENEGQGNKLWIGTNLDPEHGWQWSNGKPYRYLKWDSGTFSFHLHNAWLTVLIVAGQSEKRHHVELCMESFVVFVFTIYV